MNRDVLHWGRYISGPSQNHMQNIFHCSFRPILGNLTKDIQCIQEWSPSVCSSWRKLCSSRQRGSRKRARSSSAPSQTSSFFSLTITCSHSKTDLSPLFQFFFLFVLQYCVCTVRGSKRWKIYELAGFGVFVADYVEFFWEFSLLCFGGIFKGPQGNYCSQNRYLM